MRSSRRLLSLSVALGCSLAAGCSVKLVPPRAGHPALARPLGDQRLVPLTAAAARPVNDGPAAERARAQIASAASAVVGAASVAGFRADCSGSARGIYANAGFDIDDQALATISDENDVARLHRLVERVGSLRQSNPRVGDLVFFDDTYDKNRDGVRNDPLTHVGIVEQIRDDDTVVFVHRVGSGILRYRMNLSQPRVRRGEGRAVLNHFLRRGEGDARPRTAAELFAGYGTVLLAPIPTKGESLATVLGPKPRTR